MRPPSFPGPDVSLPFLPVPTAGSCPCFTRLPQGLVGTSESPWAGGPTVPAVEAWALKGGSWGLAGMSLTVGYLWRYTGIGREGKLGEMQLLDDPNLDGHANWRTEQTSPLGRQMAGYVILGSLTCEISIFSYLEGKILNFWLLSSVMAL